MYQGYEELVKNNFFGTIVITDDGYESHYQVNHLGPFLLTLELLPIILDTAHACGDARIVMVSSSGHTYSVFDPENMNGERDYGAMKFYCHSKLYNVSHSRKVCLTNIYVLEYIYIYIYIGYVTARRIYQIYKTEPKGKVLYIWYCPSAVI